MILLPVVNFIEKHCLNWFRAVFFYAAASDGKKRLCYTINYS